MRDRSAVAYLPSAGSDSRRRSPAAVSNGKGNVLKIAILSDVHGNLEALRVVLDEIRCLAADQIWSLGDTVGYGPEPEACVAALREAAVVQLMGNHDAAVTEKTSVAEFNENALRAVEWTRSVIGEETCDFLAGLPYESRRDNFFLVHASPEEPPRWHYIMDLQGAGRSFDFFTEAACFVGHTHVPFIVVRGEDGQVDVLDSRDVRMQNGCRYLVNVGSVGQPRDLDPRASFAMLDLKTGSLEIRRIPYPVEKTQMRMRSLGLPPFLIDRLSVGR